MAEVGKNAKFYDFGGASGSGSEGGDLLSRVLGNLPMLFAKANLEGEALNGEAVTDTIRQLVESIATPIKGDATSPSTSDSDAE